MSAGQKRLLDFTGYGTGAGSPSSGAITVAGMKLFDFAGYPVGSVQATVTALPPITGGTPLLFDFQQVDLMEMQSFFAAWAIAYPVRPVVSETISINCGDLDAGMQVQGYLDNPEGIITCCID